MENSEFEKLVDKHSLCPGNILYNSNALAGEAGECANVVKKIHMATIRPEWVAANEERLKLPTVKAFQNDLRVELSDELFYLVRLAKDNGFTLSELMQTQAEKLYGQSIEYGRNFLK